MNPLLRLLALCSICLHGCVASDDGAGPDASPVAAPDAAPVAAPDAAPVAAPDAAPVATPDAASEPDTFDAGADASPPSIDAGSAPMFSDGFESGDLTSWRCSGNCPGVTSSPAFAGTYSGNFVLDRSMATPYRTEVVVDGGLYFEFGQDYRLQMSYRYEDWATDSDTEGAPFQIHTRPSDWSAGCSLGSAYSTAPFLMVSRDGVTKFITYGGKTLWEAPLEPRQWHTVRVDFRISTGSDGFIEAWQNGVRLGRVDGRNSPDTDRCDKPMRTPYFKMGIYKWNWKVDRPATDSTRRQLLIDDVSVYEQ